MVLRFICLLTGLFFGIVTNSVLAAKDTVSLLELGTYSTGVFDESAAEIVAFDPSTERLFVVNTNSTEVDILNASNPANPTKIASISASDIGGGINSVAISGKLLAVAIEADAKQDNGYIAFYNTKSLKLINIVEVGALPDMVVFTPNGRFALVANEGEPNDEYTIDPEGSISIIEIIGNTPSAIARTVNFRKFNGREDSLRAAGIRIYGPNASAAQDLEPEYIAVSTNSRTAWVSLQENNAYAVINIAQARVTKLLPLGTKDHQATGNELDASNKDNSINIKNWPIKGMYMPDTIKAYQAKGTTYIVSANEGDSRDYGGYSEEVRVKDLDLDEARFPNADSLKEAINLGRLKVSAANGDIDSDGDYDEIFSYGARSFSIRDASGNLVFDSGSDFERVSSNALGNDFNSNNDKNGSGDSRSDDKGPEPEALEIAQISGRTYAFIGLERVGGIMIYDITDPTRVNFLNYINNRDFSVSAQLNDGTSNPDAGDLGVECLLFIPAAKSPNGKPLLVSSNEVSGSTTIYEIRI